MNILIIALDFKPRTGGIAEYTHRVATHLTLAGDDVTVFSMTMPGAEEFDAMCPYHVLRGDSRLFSYSREGGGIRRLARMYKQIRRVAVERRSDVVIINALTSQPHVCWLVAQTMGLPYCVFTHGLRVRENYRSDGSVRGNLRATAKRLKRRLVLRRADLVFANSSYTKELVVGLGVPESKVAVRHPGVDLKELRPPMGGVDSLELPNGTLQLRSKKVILTIGRLVERKGIDKVIEALSQVSDRIDDFLYVIVGEGPYRKTLEDLVRGFGLSEKVMFTGYVSEERRDLYYSVADVFIMPSRELPDGHVEGFGIVFLEANAFAKPVIGGRSGGVVDAIAHGVTGLLVDPLDTDEISWAITKLLEDNDYARQLGEQGRERVAREFDWTHIVPRMRQDLEAIA